AVHVVPREPFVIARSIAQGAERWVDVVRHPDAEHAAEMLRTRGYELVATHPDGELVPEDLARIPRLALVFGNEHDGISTPLRLAAARSVRIPMRGMVESLNLSVSAAVLLAAATAGREGDLSGGERTRLYAKGLYRTVERAGEVL